MPTRRARQSTHGGEHRWAQSVMARAGGQALLADESLDDFPQRVVELASDGFFEWRPASQHFRYSPSVANLLGYERGELPLNETSVAAHVYCDDFLALKRAMAEAARTGEDLEFEVRAYTKSGELRWFQLHLAVVERNAQGGIERAIGCVSDVDNITRARQEWQRLADAEQWLSQTIEELVHQPDDSALTNCLTRLCEFLDVDHASLRRVEDGSLFHLVAMGHHPANAAPLGLYSTLSRDDLFDAFDTMVKGQPLLVDDVSQVDFGGHRLGQQLPSAGVKSIAFFPVHYQGKFDYYLSLLMTRKTLHWNHNIVQTAQLLGETMAMVAGRQHVTQTMSRNEVRMQHALDATGDGIWEWDRSRGHYFVSPSFLYIAGYDEELLPLSAEKLERLLVPPATVETFFADYSHQRHKPPGNFEFVISLRHRSGRDIPVLVRGKQTAWDDAGRPTACVGVATELHTLQHLTRLGPAPHFHSLNEDGAGSLADVSKRVESFHVRDFFDELSPSLTRTASKKGLRLSRQLSVSLPEHLSGPAAKLRACIRAVVNSAVAVTEHGEIQLAVSAGEAGADNVNLQVAVSDSGRQLTGDERSALSGDNETAVPAALSELRQCWQWLRNQNGDLEIQPRRGGGNRYSLSLPLSIATSTASGTESQPEPPDESALLSQAMILLAEDNPINQQVASGMLRRKGARVTVANNGQEAVDILQAAGDGSFDLVLMDLEMPVMDGFEATRELRQSDRFGRLPIVALTAYAGQSDKDQCFQVGMNDHLAKPVKPALLYSTLAKYLKPRSQSGQA